MVVHENDHHLSLIQRAACELLLHLVCCDGRPLSEYSLVHTTKNRGRPLGEHAKQGGIILIKKLLLNVHHVGFNHTNRLHITIGKSIDGSLQGLSLSITALSRQRISSFIRWTVVSHGH